MKRRRRGGWPSPMKATNSRALCLCEAVERIDPGPVQPLWPGRFGPQARDGHSPRWSPDQSAPAAERMVYAMTEPAGRTTGKPEQILYSVEEAASMLGIGRTFMFHLIATGAIESFKIGNRRKIPGDAIRAYIRRLLSEQSALA